MSIDFDDAPMCNGKYCTNLLTSWSDFKRGFCDICAWEDQNEQDKKAEEKKIEEAKEI